MISSYWIYHTLIKLTLGISVGIGDLAFLIEPILLFAAAGAATAVTGGKRAVLWAFVVAVVISTFFGFGSIYVGGKFLKLNEILHATLLSKPRHVDAIHRLTLGNAGLSLFIFRFAYQLATAMMIALALLLSNSTKKTEKSLLLICLIFLAAGMMSNGERSIVLSLAGGAVCFICLSRNYALIIKMMLVMILCAFLFYFKSYLSVPAEGLDTLSNRMDFGLEQFGRIKAALIAVASVLHHPFGSGEMSPYYAEFARKHHYISGSGQIFLSHNDFANTIMFTGVVGVAAILSFLIVYARILLYFRNHSQEMQHEIVIFAGSITALANSFAHNQGLFSREFAVCFTMGLVFASYKKRKRSVREMNRKDTGQRC